MAKPSYFQTLAASYDDDMDYAAFAAMCEDEEPIWTDEDEEPIWTDEDEVALEQWEEERRQRIAEANEY